MFHWKLKHSYLPYSTGEMSKKLRKFSGPLRVVYPFSFVFNNMAALRAFAVLSAVFAMKTTTKILEKNFIF